MSNKEKLTKENVKDSIATGSVEEEKVFLAGQTSAMVELLPLFVRRYDMETDTLQANKTVRWWLMPGLTLISVIWLLYTGIIINCLAFDYPFGSVSGRFSDAIAIAFMTTSLATVLGLWHFGLQYFFTPKV